MQEIETEITFDTRATASSVLTLSILVLNIFKIMTILKVENPITALGEITEP